MQPPTAARTVHYHPDGLARDLHLFRVIAEDAHTLQEPRLHYNHSHTFDHYHFHEEEEITTTFAVTIVAVLIYLRDLSAASAAFVLCAGCISPPHARVRRSVETNSNANAYGPASQPFPTHVCVDR